MSSLGLLRRVVEIEFSDIVVQTDLLGSKLRVLLIDTSYVDVWSSRKLKGRFGFHWERRHLDGYIYRYDNFSDANWADVPTFPFHVHDADQNNVIAAPFARSVEKGFREFMALVQQLKEITYAHCEGIFSSEFKHGPLSAVHDGYPVVFVTAPGDEMMINHVNEVTVRGGRATALAAVD